MKILLVGVGLIGGSFSLALKNRKDLEFGGYDIDTENLKEAGKLDIISKSFQNQKEAIEWSDVILLSIPVDAIKVWLKENLQNLSEDQLVVDFGSTKSTICESVKDHPKRKQFLAAHPIAGTEYSGASSAFASLYKDKNLILCDVELTNTHLLNVFENLALAAGFYLTKMNSKEHDRHLAYISHLSHITSYALSQAVLKKEKDGEVILDLAGSGFASTVRLAKSSPEMWSAIFSENKEMVLQAIAAYRTEIGRMFELIDGDELEAMKAYLNDARAIRKILK